MQDKILLAHGGGALLTESLIRDCIASRFTSAVLHRLDDAAVLPSAIGQLAFTTDSYVVSPYRFPGGTIGDLAVCGTVNDLAMVGAKPLYLSLALILEEGLPIAELEAILDAVQMRANEAEVEIVCGDTKVVPKGEADGIYINTAGIGILPENVDISSHNAQVGDALIVSGVVGLHGLAVMLARGNLSLQSPVESDVAPLNGMVQALLEAGIRIHALRDLTRGGLSMGLYDIAEHSGVTLEIQETEIPMDTAQSAACDILGLDPLHVACEGRFLAVVHPEDVSRSLDILRGFEVGKKAEMVGQILERDRYGVTLVTSIGSRRVLTPPRGEQMPRIC